MSINTEAKNPDPMIFEEFFELGQEETSSPFIIPSSRPWGSNLHLKSSIAGAILLIISFILSFYESTVPLSHFLLVGVYFLVGVIPLIEALENLANLEINIDILMTLAAFSSILIGSGMEGGLLLVLFALSGAMEEYVSSKAKSDISSLHRLAPTRAFVIESDGTLLERSVRDITVGTRILIRAGQLVPLDGVVIDGISSVNLVHLTGESLPVTKRIGDEVPAGARNFEGTLTVRVTRTSADSTLSRIIQLVTQAQEERPVLQRWFDKLSRGYAITIMSLSALFAIGLAPLMSIPYLGFEGSVYRALAFLIAASPCALILAIPIAYLSAIGACARQGILLKGGIALDALARCKVIAFDKTGTLTTGNLELVGIEVIGEEQPYNAEEAIAIAFALERSAMHPIAKAIVAYCQQRKGTMQCTVREFKAIPGYGLNATAITSMGETEVYVGHSEYIRSKITLEMDKVVEEQAEKARQNGELVAVLLIGKQLFLLRFQDTLRLEIKKTLEELKYGQGLKLIMLTGDHENSARVIAKELGLDEYYANLKPEDKLLYVSKIAATRPLAMIGDGINDAPALARATVGICMGKVGSTAAIDAADIILLQDNIEALSWLVRKSRQTQSIVVQNLLLATLAIIFASLPALAGLVPLWLAVVMHEGGTVLVGLNGLRLLKK